MLFRSYQQARIGEVATVLCEGFDDEQGLYYGRDYANAPDIDGRIYFNSSRKKVKPGQFVRVKIKDADPYDLYGSVVK